MPPQAGDDGPLEWEVMIRFPLPYLATIYRAGGFLTIRIPFDAGRQAAEEALASMDARVRAVRREHLVVTGEVVPERKMISDVPEPE